MAQQLTYYPFFNPSVALAGVVAGLYGVSLVVSLVQIFRKRSWVWLVMAVAVAMEVVGYAARVVSARNPTEKNPYVIQFCLVILAPVLMAGVIYVLFSRIVFWVVPPESRSISLLWVPPRFITLIFVGFDIVALLLQLIAAVLISGTDKSDPNAKKRLNLGKTLGLAGVSLQMVGFGLFSIAAARFHFASKRVDPNFAKSNAAKHGIMRDWSRLLLVVNASCVLILIRSVFREVEFAEGKTGETQQHEWYMYVFDTLPILLVVVLYNIWFPGSFLKHLGFRLPKQYRQLSGDPETHQLQSR